MWTQHRTSQSVRRWKLSEQNFGNFPLRGRFSPKKTQNWALFPSLATSGRHNYAMIIDRRKFITKWPLYGMSSSQFYRWNQLKLILLATTLGIHGTYSKLFYDAHRTPLTKPHDEQSGRDLMTSSGHERPHSIQLNNGKLGHWPPHGLYLATQRWR